VKRTTSAPQNAPAEAQRPAAAPAWGYRDAAAAAVLVLLVGAAFSPCLSNDFAWDDCPFCIFQSPLSIAHGLRYHQEAAIIRHDRPRG
jgi:hypothetical protein